MQKRLLLFLTVVIVLFAGLLPIYAAEKNVTPKVISTIPQNGSRTVDPSLTEISVTFSEPMMDKSWSWSYEDKDKFPQMTGQPYCVNNTKCVLPVKLEPKKEYVIWINTVKFKNFKSKTGIPAEPYKVTFRTK